MQRAQRDLARMAGATVVVTRPVGSAASSVRAVRAAGGEPLRLPGLRLRACADANVRAAGRDNDIRVFTSPAAVRFAFAAGLRASPRVAALAVGEGTRAALLRHGQQARAPSGRADSEALLALPELAGVRGKRIALFGAPGGRDAIAPALRARGAQVEVVHVYQRERPRLTRRHLAAIEAAGSPLATLVSSGEALSNLVALLPSTALKRLQRGLLVASSPRIEALARACGFGRVVVAESALPRDLLAAAATRLGRRRQ